VPLLTASKLAACMIPEVNINVAELRTVNSLTHTNEKVKFCHGAAIYPEVLPSGQKPQLPVYRVADSPRRQATCYNN
jgi:hypothetical protein